MYKFVSSFFLISILSANAMSLTHNQVEVESILSPDSRPCTFFRLKGVVQADPAVNNHAWFSVPLDHNGHDVIVSMLLTAYAAGKKLNVVTTGREKCGIAEVESMLFAY
ncbi:MAG: hypothetical protein ACJAUP_002837 [Cellvibrionaceae bacterium]|jgi:hypothetical protein